jgi:hypothetical protein
MQNSHTHERTRSAPSSWTGRAQSGLSSARREATTPRIAAAVAVGAAAAALGLLRDPQRRERLRRTASELKGRLGLGHAPHAARSHPATS